jgi:hypothetical protein
LLIFNTISVCDPKDLTNFNFNVEYITGDHEECYRRLISTCKDNYHHIVRIKHFNTGVKPVIGKQLAKLFNKNICQNGDKSVKVFLTLKFDWRFAVNQIDFYTLVIDQCINLFGECSFYVSNWVNFYQKNNIITKADESYELLFNRFFEKIKSINPSANIISINNCTIKDHISYIQHMDHIFTVTGSMQHTIFYFTETKEFVLGTILKNFKGHTSKFKYFVLPDDCYTVITDPNVYNDYYQLNPVNYKRECDTKLKFTNTNEPYIIDIDKSIPFIKDYLTRNK